MEDTWGPEHSTKARGTASDNWGTNPEDFHAIDLISRTLYLEGIRTDAAAGPDSTLRSVWWGPRHHDPTRTDALKANWVGPSFLNPPYSRVAEFARCASLQPDPVLMLTFARLDTGWVWQHVLPKAHVIFVRRGRCRFRDPVTGNIGASAPTPSMVVCYGRPTGVVKPVGNWFPLFPHGVFSRTA